MAGKFERSDYCRRVHENDDGSWLLAHDDDDCGHCRGCLVINYVACGAWQCASENLAIVMKVAFRCLETGNETYDVSQFVLYWNWFENLRVVTSRIIKFERWIKAKVFHVWVNVFVSLKRDWYWGKYKLILHYIYMKKWIKITNSFQATNWKSFSTDQQGKISKNEIGLHIYTTVHTIYIYRFESVNQTDHEIMSMFTNKSYREMNLLFAQ